MHIITFSVTFFSIKIQLFNDFKEGFVNRIREEFKKRFSIRQLHFMGRASFWWVDRSAANQQF